MIASSVADKTLADIRSWARNINHYRGGLAAYDNVQRTDPDHPNFRILSTVSKSGGVADPDVGLGMYFPR